MHAGNIKNSFFKGFKWIFLITWAIIQLFPVYWMFTFSLKNNNEIFGANVIGFPNEWLWSNYQKALTVGHMLRYFGNSIIVAVGTIVIVMIFSVMATYALTRLKWEGQKTVNSIFMLGLTIPIHAALLPIFLIMRNLKILNSYQSLIIPYAAFSLAMAILVAGVLWKEFQGNSMNRHV